MIMMGTGGRRRNAGLAGARSSERAQCGRSGAQGERRGAGRNATDFFQ